MRSTLLLVWVAVGCTMTSKPAPQEPPVSADPAAAAGGDGAGGGGAAPAGGNEGAIGGGRNKKCLKETGCPSAAVAAKCGADVKPVALAEMARNAAQWEGKPVSVAGPLRHTQPACTRMACAPNSCCNGCRAQLVIAESADGAGGLPLAIGDAGGPACHGDDSLLCCGYPAAGEKVVATGKLVKDGAAWKLEGATVCEP